MVTDASFVPHPQARTCTPDSPNGHFDHLPFRPSDGDWTYCACRCENPSAREGGGGTFCRDCQGYVGQPTHTFIDMPLVSVGGMTLLTSRRIEIGWLLPIVQVETGVPSPEEGSPDD